MPFTVQDFILPIVLGSTGYFLTLYPGYFAAVLLGLTGLLFTPVGVWLVKPHAERGVDMGVNITKSLISQALDSAVGNFTNHEAEVLKFEQSVQEIIKTSMSKGVGMVNSTMQNATNLTTDFIADLTAQVFAQEETVTKLAGQCTDALKGVFANDFFSDLKNTLGVVADNRDWHGPLIKKMEEAAMYVVTDLQVKESMGVACEGQVRQYINEPAFRTDFLKTVERVAHQFKDAMQVAGSGLLR